jgi:hypothetical protein
MTLTKEQEKMILFVLLVLFAGMVVYRILAGEVPRTAPLIYTPGMKVATPVRRGLLQPSERGQDALTVLLTRRTEKYPGVKRDLFRMNRPKPRPVLVVQPKPVVTVPTLTVPVKTPEEIAADAARADLSSFRFLGYVTDKDSSLFLSKDGELFIAKSGDTLLKDYMIKAAGKDYVLLLDRATKVEVRVELSGSGDGRQK